MIGSILAMLGSTILQAASFTLVSRARNSSSIGFNAIASAASNLIWVFVLRSVVQHLDSLPLMVAYVVGSVIGSVSMHALSMRYFERRSTAGRGQ